MEAKRVSVQLNSQDNEVLQWMVDCTGGNMTDAIRTALDIVKSSANDDIVHQHYLELKKKDRAP